MNKSTINIEIIKLKPVIKQATICVINKLVKQLRQINKENQLLLNSTKKQEVEEDEEPLTKATTISADHDDKATGLTGVIGDQMGNATMNFIKIQKLKRKIENITEKIQYLKGIDKLKLAKTILTYTDDPKKIYSNPLSKPCDSATAMVYEFKAIQQKLQAIKQKFNLIPMEDDDDADDGCDDDESKTTTTSIKENHNSSQKITNNRPTKDDKNRANNNNKVLDSSRTTTTIDDIEQNHQQWLRLIKTNGRKKEIKLKIEQHKKFIELKKKEKLERKAMNKNRSEWLIENLTSTSNNDDDDNNNNNTINTTSGSPDNENKEERQQQQETIDHQPENDRQKKKEQPKQLKRKPAIKDNAKKLIGKKSKVIDKTPNVKNDSGNDEEGDDDENTKKMPKITSIQENQIVEDTFFIKQNKSYLLNITKNKQLNNSSGKLSGNKNEMNGRESTKCNGLSNQFSKPTNNNNNNNISKNHNQTHPNNSNWKNNNANAKMINSSNTNNINNNNINNNSKPKVVEMKNVAEENLHPSWIAAKMKKQQGIQSFQGTKITFDDD